MIRKLLQIPVGFIFANGVEWGFHKYVLHGLGKNKSSVFSAHWNEHHKVVRKNGMLDLFYSEPFFSCQINNYEFKSLIIGALGLLPISFTFPFFYGTVISYGISYYALHMKSHLDLTWAKKYLPWHYDHHMIGNQSHNWNVVVPFFDYVFGTRIKRPKMF